MADPSQMFNVPQQTEGPLAGYMRGIMGDYGIQQQNQAVTQRDIANQQAQLALENSQKDVPVQDLGRQVTSSQLNDQIANWGNGNNAAAAQAVRDKGIAESQLAMNTTQVAQTNAKLDWWTTASQVMGKTEPAKKQEVWDQQVKEAKKLGITSVDPQWNGLQTQSDLDAHRDAATNSRPVLGKMAEERQKINDQTDASIKLWKAELPGRKEIAEAQSNLAINKSLWTMPPDQRAITLADDKAAHGAVLTQQDFGTLMSAERSKIIQSKELDGVKQGQATRYATSTPDQRKDMNKLMGKPDDAQDADSWGSYVLARRIDEQAANAVKTRYPEAKIAVNGEVKKITDVIGESGSIPKGLLDASPSAQATKASASSGPVAPFDPTHPSANFNAQDEANVKEAMRRGNMSRDTALSGYIASRQAKGDLRFKAGAAPVAAPVASTPSGGFADATTAIDAKIAQLGRDPNPDMNQINALLAAKKQIMNTPKE
jgi:hypothetical protein